MSKASDWAHFTQDAMKARPQRRLRHLECWAAEKPLAKMTFFTASRYGLRQFAADLTPGEARAYARWILATLGDE